MKNELLLYMFSIHGGHDQLFEDFRESTHRVSILGPDFLKDYEGHHKVIGAINPYKIAGMIQSLGYFPEVRVVNFENIAELNQYELIMTDEKASRKIHEQYFPDTPVKYYPVFLQWNKERVYSESPVNYDATISREKLDEYFLDLAKIQADMSSDWWRHVGGVVIKDGEVIFAGYNEHLPSEHMPYLFCDPRVFVEAGKDSHICTAIHSEQSIIAEAARRILEGTSLYVTTFPCPVCAKLIARAGIKKVYFREGHASLDGETILKSYGVEIIHVE